jgi:hypothetical protein
MHIPDRDRCNWLRERIETPELVSGSCGCVARCYNLCSFLQLQHSPLLCSLCCNVHAVLLMLSLPMLYCWLPLSPSAGALHCSNVLALCYSCCTAHTISLTLYCFPAMFFVNFDLREPFTVQKCSLTLYCSCHIAHTVLLSCYVLSQF